MNIKIEDNKLKDILANATPGPWAYESHGDTQTYGVGVCYEFSDEEMTLPLSGQVGSDVLVVDPICPEVSGHSNAQLIALAPQLAADNISLQAEVIRLKAEIYRIKEE